MKDVDLYARVRRAVYVDGMSQRGAARYFGIDPRTVAKMMRFSVPPGYRRRRRPARPKLDPFTGIIDQILDDDGSIPAKQRHTAKRIFERLRDEHGYGGGYTTVKDYVRVRRQQRREVFVPLWHPAGHGQADFGEAVAVIGGVAQKVHLFVMDLPQSDAGFVKAYPAETTEAFLDGHVSAFAFFGGVPRSILYDNTRLAVVRVLGDGRRQRTRAFSELTSHYLFEDRFGRPGKGNDKGKVENLVGYARRNYLVPLPRAVTFEELNAQLEARCRRRLDDRLRGHVAAIGTRLTADRAAFLDLPAVPYEPCEKRPGRSARCRWWVRHPPGARAHDGGRADGRAGQAQLQAAPRSADRGERGSPGAREGAPEPGQRQYRPLEGVPGRGADPDRRQQRRVPALDAGAVSVPGRGRRLPAPAISRSTARSTSSSSPPSGS